MLDISGFRAEKRTELERLAEETVAQVRADGRVGRAGPDDAVRAQGRARRGRRGRPDVGERGRGAPPLRRRPARLSRPWTMFHVKHPGLLVTRERPGLPLGASGSPTLAGHRAGVERGLIGPREAPRLWDRHLLNCAMLAEAIPPGVRVVRPRLRRRPAGSGAGHRPPRPAGHAGRAAASGGRPSSTRRWRSSPSPRRGACAAGPRRCTASGSSTWSPSRAVAPLDRLLEWSMPLVAPDGRAAGDEGRVARGGDRGGRRRPCASCGVPHPRCSSSARRSAGRGLSTTRAVRVAHADPSRVAWRPRVDRRSGGGTGDGADSGRRVPSDARVIHRSDAGR